MKPRIICPKCSKEYFETSGGKKGKNWKKIGHSYPDLECKDTIKGIVKIKDIEKKT